MKVVAISSIEVGEEIVTSYVDLALPTKLRREELKDRYHFECGCESCLGISVEGKLDPRQALRCGEDKCNGLISMPSKSIGFLRFDFLSLILTCFKISKKKMEIFKKSNVVLVNLFTLSVLILCVQQ